MNEHACLFCTGGYFTEFVDTGRLEPEARRVECEICRGTGIAPMTRAELEAAGQATLFGGAV